MEMDQDQDDHDRATKVWSNVLLTEKLVDLLSLPELKNMLAVSRTWPPEPLRSACIEKLDAISHVHLRDWQNTDGNTPKNITDFCNAFPPETFDTELDQDWPFSSFKISGNLTTGILEEPPERVAAFSNFFLTYGKQIRFLECATYCTTPQNLRRLHHLLSLLHPHCEVSLSIDIRPHKEKKEDSDTDDDTDDDTEPDEDDDAEPDDDDDAEPDEDDDAEPEPVDRGIHPTDWERWGDGDVLQMFQLEPLTNVRTLEIQNLCEISGIPTGLLTEYVKMCLHCFPNLQSVKQKECEQCEGEGDSYAISLINRIFSYVVEPRILRVTGTFNVQIQMPHLTELDVHLSSLGDYGIAMLARHAPSQLIKLKLKLYWVCRNLSVPFEHLLRRISQTLKVLSITVVYDNRPEGININKSGGVPPISFPAMSALQSLSVLMFWDTKNQPPTFGGLVPVVEAYVGTFEVIDYPTQFPQLKDLSFKWGTKTPHPAEDLIFKAKLNGMFLPWPPAKSETVKKVCVGDNAPADDEERSGFVDRVKGVFPNADVKMDEIQKAQIQQVEVNNNDNND